MNTKLHAVADADGRPIRFFMTAGQVSDYTGAAALLGCLPKADWLLHLFRWPLAIPGKIALAQNRKELSGTK